MMADFRTLSDTVLASPQIDPGDIGAAVDSGVTLVINNRPDGEEPGQPTGGAIAQAASDAGIEYVAIPVDGSGISREQIDRMAEALRRTDGKVLAYCRSGTRSTMLWSLARASLGDAPDTIIAKAQDAGYSMEHLRPALRQLSESTGD